MRVQPAICVFYNIDVFSLCEQHYTRVGTFTLRLSYGKWSTLVQKPEHKIPIKVITRINSGLKPSSKCCASDATILQWKSIYLSGTSRRDLQTLQTFTRDVNYIRHMHPAVSQVTLAHKSLPLLFCLRRLPIEKIKCIWN